MKMINAIIKPFKLDEVREALTDMGIEGLTAIEVRGFGRQRGQAENLSGNEYAIAFLPKIKIEIVVSDDLADTVVDTIKNTANTGRIGDGKIFVYDIERAVRIRTGEEDEAAL